MGFIVDCARLYHLTSDPHSIIDMFPLCLEPQISEVNAG